MKFPSKSNFLTGPFFHNGTRLWHSDFMMMSFCSAKTSQSNNLFLLEIQSWEYVHNFRIGFSHECFSKSENSFWHRVRNLPEKMNEIRILFHIFFAILVDKDWRFFYVKDEKYRWLLYQLKYRRLQASLKVIYLQKSLKSVGRSHI